MKILKASTADNSNVDIVTANDLAEIIRMEGMDKVEVYTENSGWLYFEDTFNELNFTWNSEETTLENCTRWIGVYNGTPTN